LTTNANLSNNAWYLAIKNNDINHIGFFLSWGGKLKDNPYELPATADSNKNFIYQDGSIWTPLLVAVKYCGEIEQKLYGGYGSSAFWTLINYGNPDLNKKGKPLLDKPEQNPISYFLLLYESLTTSPQTLFEMLLKHGANLTEGYKAYIASGGSPNHIIKHGGHKKDSSTSLLWLAIHFNDMEAVKFLINNGVDVNLSIEPYGAGSSQKDYWSHMRGSHTPLYFAMQQEDTSIADLLIEHGARV